MADMTAPTGQAPTMAPLVRTNDQILPCIRWVQTGYLKFSAKPNKREVFGMPIPGTHNEDGNPARANIKQAFGSTQKLVDEIGELKAIFGHMLGAAGVQIPKNNLNNLHSSREADGTLETTDPQNLLGLGVFVSRAIGFLEGTSVVAVILVKGHAFPTIVKVRPVEISEALEELDQFGSSIHKIRGVYYLLGSILLWRYKYVSKYLDWVITLGLRWACDGLGLKILDEDFGYLVTSSRAGWIEDLVNYHLKEIHCSSQCHTQKTLLIIVKGDECLILCLEQCYLMWYPTNSDVHLIILSLGELIQKLILNQKCMGYLVRAYYSISPTRYYKDNSCWSADLKSKTIEDIITIRSFMEVLVLNHYVLEEPGMINVWELMEGLDDTSPLILKSGANYMRSSEFDNDVINEFRNLLANCDDVLLDNDFVIDSKNKSYNPSPPRVKEKLVLYFISLRGVRKTYEDCCHVRHLLKATGVRVDERDVSMHSRFKEELKELLGGSIVFIGKKDIGGAMEIRRLHEDGHLEKALEGCEMLDSDGFSVGVGGCEACGDLRFVPCETCSGSCKSYYEYESDEVSDDDEDKEEIDYGFQKCPDCNENRLIRCPIFCD
nr:putative glutaredoxin family protein [Tanacetum cinerariifolium]